MNSFNYNLVKPSNILFHFFVIFQILILFKLHTMNHEEEIQQ